MFRIKIINNKNNSKKINQHGGDTNVHNFFKSLKGDLSNLNLQNQNRLYLNYTDHEKSILDEIYCLEKKEIENNKLDVKDRILYWSITWQKYFLNTKSPSDLIDILKLIKKHPAKNKIILTLFKTMRLSYSKEKIFNNVKLIKKIENEFKNKFPINKLQKELLSSIYYKEKSYRNKYNSKDCVVKIKNNIIVESSIFKGYYFQDIIEDNLKYLDIDVAKEINPKIKEYLDIVKKIKKMDDDIFSRKEDIMNKIDKAKDIYIELIDDDFEDRNIGQTIDEEELIQIYMDKSIDELNKILNKKEELLEIFKEVKDMKEELLNDKNNYFYKYNHLFKENFDSFDKEIIYKIVDSGNLKKITKILESFKDSYADNLQLTNDIKYKFLKIEEEFKYEFKKKFIDTSILYFREENYIKEFLERKNISKLKIMNSILKKFYKNYYYDKKDIKEMETLESDFILKLKGPPQIKKKFINYINISKKIREYKKYKLDKIGYNSYLYDIYNTDIIQIIINKKEERERRERREREERERREREERERREREEREERKRREREERKRREREERETRERQKNNMTDEEIENLFNLISNGENKINPLNMIRYFAKNRYYYLVIKFLKLAGLEECKTLADFTTGNVNCGNTWAYLITKSNPQTKKNYYGGPRDKKGLVVFKTWIKTEVNRK
jgi:hypothetical protein